MTKQTKRELIEDLDRRVMKIEGDISYILKLLKDVYSCWDHWDDEADTQDQRAS